MGSGQTEMLHHHVADHCLHTRQDVHTLEGRGEGEKGGGGVGGEKQTLKMGSAAKPGIGRRIRNITGYLTLSR